MYLFTFERKEPQLHNIGFNSFLQQLCDPIEEKWKKMDGLWIDTVTIYTCMCLCSC